VVLVVQETWPACALWRACASRASYNPGLGATLPCKTSPGSRPSRATPVSQTTCARWRSGRISCASSWRQRGRTWGRTRASSSSRAGLPWPCWWVGWGRRGCHGHEALSAGGAACRPRRFAPHALPCDLALLPCLDFGWGLSCIPSQVHAPIHPLNTGGGLLLCGGRAPVGAGSAQPLCVRELKHHPCPGRGPFFEGALRESAVLLRGGVRCRVLAPWPRAACNIWAEKTMACALMCYPACCAVRSAASTLVLLSRILGWGKGSKRASICLQAQVQAIIDCEWVVYASCGPSWLLPVEGPLAPDKTRFRQAELVAPCLKPRGLEGQSTFNWGAWRVASQPRFGSKPSIQDEAHERSLKYKESQMKPIMSGYVQQKRSRRKHAGT